MNRFAKLPDWLKITLLATGLRWLWITHENLWFDEAFTALVVRPGTDFWRAVIGDNHPPLWNLIEAVVVRIFGESEFTLRFPALVFGVGAVLLVWAIARDLFGRQISLTAGLIAAMLPAAVYYSQDARMYSALAFFVLLMVYAANRRQPVLYIVAGLGAVYTQNVGVCFVAAIGIGYAISRGSWRALWPSAAVALGWLPWAGVVLTQVGRTQAGYWAAPITLGGALYPGILTTMGWRMTEAVEAPVVCVIILLSMITIWTIRRWWRYPSTWILLAAVVGGPLLLLAFSLSIVDVWVYRALLPAGMMLCILWAYTLHQLRGESRFYVRLLFSFALGIALLSHYFPAQSRPDVQAWNAPIKAGWQPGDYIYYLNAGDVIANELYIQYPYALRPTPANLLAITEDCREAFGLVIQPLAELGAQRIWVTFNQMPYTPQEEVDYFNILLKKYRHEFIKAAGDAVLYRFDLVSDGSGKS